MLDLNNVYHGDCLEVMGQIDDQSIDMILCDLPYGMTSCSWDSIIPFEELWNHYKRIIRKGGVIVLTGSQPFTSALVMSNPKWFKYEIIWEKDNCTNFMNANKIIMKVHENICVFYTSRPIYNPQKFYKGRSTKINSGLSEPAHLYGGIKKRTDYVNIDGMRYPRSVQKFKSEKGLHPTQKPVLLFEWLIKTYTHPGMTVLDNCAGSGTTGIAAINTGRNFILIERDEKYFEACKQRIFNYKQGNLEPSKTLKNKKYYPVGQLHIEAIQNIGINI